ncbi:putative CCR4-associated factor 1 [Cardamine amara subsp. amara]|uniref:poly(A)-specific ribonuclease n=1 Tax=Cardamine amara subsp. amara TaxID=228776 RepID=A0ABD1AFD6_CARAN
MSLIEKCLRTHKWIAMDTEFPGSLRETSQNATDQERYNDMRFSVGKTKVIQLGLTLFDVNGSIGGTWEINFADFRETEDARNEKSIGFLKRNGLDLKKIREEGIGIRDFFLDLNLILKQTRNITWVTFHGSYDIAYLLKGLTGESLPVTSDRFSKSVARILGSVYDLKVMADRCNGLSSRLGLQSLANEVGLNRVGTAHHAGSDSELTARVFAKIFDNVGDSEGYIYGLGHRIISDRLKQEAMMMHQMHMNHVMMMSRCYGPPPPPFPLRMPRFVPGHPPFGGLVLVPRV